MLAEQLIQVIKIIGYFLFDGRAGQLAFIIGVQIGQYLVDAVGAFDAAGGFLQRGKDKVTVYFNENFLYGTGAKGVVMCQMNPLVFNRAVEHQNQIRKGRGIRKMHLLGQRYGIVR